MRQQHHTRRAAIVLATACLITGPISRASAAVVTDVFGGTIACTTTSGVQFCEGDVNTRVESWDGVPLDVNVTIPPAAMTGPFPLILELHGWAQSKTATPSVDRALAGYVVVNYTARGFHASCGDVASRFSDPSLSDPDACADYGWTHLADTRYEGRDSQYLAGLLVDEGLVIPTKIAATGASYGGMRSMALAMLKNRVMLPDGSLVPWTSPLGTPMEVAATAPLIPPSDLAYSLYPNGATLDYRVDNPYGDRAGVVKTQWTDLLYNSGLAVAYYAPVGVDPTADLTGWKIRVEEGEPYEGDAEAEAIVDEMTEFHSPYYIDMSIEPAPMFIYNAWTDDLFPANEAIRIWRKIKDTYPSADVNLHFADAFGHPRSGLAGDTVRVFTRVQEFLDFHLLGVGSAVPTLEVYTQPCGDSPEVGPIVAADWDAIHPGEVVFTDTSAQSINQASGDTDNAIAVAPVPGPPCRSLPPGDDSTAANYTFAATASGYTMVGSPTIIADLTTSGPEFAQIVGRLWDVAPDGTQYLISRGSYRPRVDGVGRQVFQLPPNGWEFAVGHSPKLELLGRSEPNSRASNGTFNINVSNLELRLPVIEAPGGEVTAPLPHVLPPTGIEAPSCPVAPQTTCRVPSAPKGSKVSLKASKPGKEKLKWSWKKGPATTGAEFGAGLTSKGYSLCIWTADDALVMSAKAPITGDCSGNACWVSKSSGEKHLYKDKELARGGTFKVILRGGEAGKASAKMLGRGPNLAIAALPISPMPVTIQFIDGDGGCWGATYSVLKKADSTAWSAQSN
jgi:hypothetical protein